MLRRLTHLVNINKSIFIFALLVLSYKISIEHSTRIDQIAALRRRALSSTRKLNKDTVLYILEVNTGVPAAIARL